MYRYVKLIEEQIIARRNLDTVEAMERYDVAQKEWIKDWGLYEVFTGDVRIQPLTEEEAWKELNLQG